MKVRLRYFASIREALGAGEVLDIDPGITAGGIRDALIARGGAHAATLARVRVLRMALNQVLCDEVALVTPDAELAFFPPVTGG